MSKTNWDEKRTTEERLRKKKENRWFNERTSARYRLADFLSEIAPGTFTSPHIHNSRAFHEERDPQEWEDHRVSSVEHIRTWGLWTVEAYTPDYIESLLKQLDNLSPISGVGIEREPGDYLRKQRYHPGSTLNLDFYPRGSTGPIPSGFYLPLPYFAKHSAGTLLAVTPSLTLFSMFHFFHEDQRDNLDVISHADYPTVITPLGRRGGHSISSPENEKRSKIEEQRRSWAMSAANWQKCHFPGLFSQGDTIPSCEFSIISGTEAFPTGRGTRNNLLAALELDWSIAVFDSDKSKGDARFQFSPWSRRERPHLYSVLVAEEADFSAQEPHGWGAGEIEGLVFKLDDRFRRTFAVWSILEVLTHFRDQISRARDQAASVIGSKNAAKALTRVRADSSQCFDASTVARELKEDPSLSQLERMAFTLRRERPKQTVKSMSQILTEDVQRRATTLLQDVSELNSNLHAQANLLSAHANLKLQPWIVILAVASAIAGIIAAIEPAMKILVR